VLVGAHADDGRLLDAVLLAVGDVGHRPRAWTAEGDATVDAAVQGPPVGPAIRGSRVGAAVVRSRIHAGVLSAARRARRIAPARAGDRRRAGRRRHEPPGRCAHRPTPLARTRAPTRLRGAGQLPGGRSEGRRPPLSPPLVRQKGNRLPRPGKRFAHLGALWYRGPVKIVAPFGARAVPA